MVVLYKTYRMAYRLIKLFLIVTFKKKSSIIAKYVGLNKYYIRNCKACDLHQ